MGDPAYIPAAWSLALLTHCRAHSRPLRSRCPICFVEEPLLTPPQKSGFFCRSCGFDFSVNFIREKPAPRIKAVMALEDAYLKAVWGTAPDPRWLRGISSRDFRLLVESLVVLFSSRLQARRTSWRRSCSTTKSLSDITSAVMRRKQSSLTSHGTGVLPSFSV